VKKRVTVGFVRLNSGNVEEIKARLAGEWYREALEMFR
jgi:hypothetical protein